MRLLPTDERCKVCLDAVGSDTVSPAWVRQTHWEHRPPHPNEVGANRRREARQNWAAWERSALC